MKIFQLLALLFFCSVMAFNVRADINENTTINDIHQQMQSKQLTSEQLVQFYLKRIATYDDKGMTLNSVVQLNKNHLTFTSLKVALKAACMVFLFCLKTI